MSSVGPLGPLGRVRRAGPPGSVGRRRRVGPLIVGLTGGIATGKSTVSKMFAGLGATVVDTDAIAREVVAPGEPALQKIRRAFGLEVIGRDGELDRAAMRKLVFADDAARERLQAITHPAIVARAKGQVDAARARFRREGSPKIIILEVPLLYEAGEPWTRMADRVVVVRTSREEQVARLTGRRKLSQAEAERMIAAQISTDLKASWADDVIRNEGGKGELRAQVRQLWERWGLS